MAYLRMARPMLRNGSKKPYYRKRIPRDVLDQVRGRVLTVTVGETARAICISPTAEFIKVTLDTYDPAEAKERHAALDAHLGKVFRAIRSTAPLTLAHEDCVALAGEFYRACTSGAWAEAVLRKVVHGEIGGDLGTVAEVWSNALGHWVEQQEKGSAEEALGPLVDPYLFNRGLRIDDKSRTVLLAEIARTLNLAFAQQQRRAEGDYSPDANAQRFPTAQPAPLVSAKQEPDADQSTSTELFKRWSAHPDQAGTASSTLASYAAVFKKLAAHLKKEHRKEPPAATLTKADFRSFIDMRSEAGISPKTINAVELCAINSVFNWAVEQDILPGGNPAKGVKRKAGKNAGSKRRETLNGAEAKAILTRAFHYKRPNTPENPKTTAAKRWVPWLMAYTGTRVGEMAQLRKADVVMFDGHWAIKVTPEAGTTKTGGTWHVPLHLHLIEQGFLDFVKSAPDGHLFLTPRPDRYAPDPDKPRRTDDENGILGPLQGLKNRLATFAKEAMPHSDETTPKPNHGWRHTFKARARENGIDEEVRNAFADHASGNVAGGYGRDAIFSAMVAALPKIPRYDVR